ncbi:PREDICTED: spermatogenesis-associated protein 5-like protein 1 [Bactrocera latifrons]|uniref:Spermatogenesis-associated protein 5-like protein 1 n=1 Tax=Bactrocera latifrons TaxID=174628 RepID=A0A0K8UB72_BACLA|nr:PREDICTED: spermatogenesis-associated protein 5-like protein 1 [Bactrocera latifrons]
MKFDLDQKLTVLPLQIIEEFTFQKCLLPKQIFTKNGLRPGAWMKCCVERTGFDNCCFLCQVYPRDINVNCCYLDYGVGTTTVLEKGCILNCLEAIECQTGDSEQVTVTLEIGESFFKSRLRKLSISLLTIAIKQILTPLNLMIGSVVRTKSTNNFGIFAIHIDSCINANGNTLFQLDSQTQLYINNIYISVKSNALEVKQFFKHGYESVWKEIEDLLCNSRLRDMHIESNGIRPHLNALLIGPPGCGKTAILNAFVEQHKCNCFYISTENVLHEYPGEAEAQLRKEFENALYLTKHLKSKNPTIIIFENIDLLCPLSNNASSTDAGNSNRICVQLVKLLDELHNSDASILCIATSSNPSAINASVRRPGRFQHEITIDWPNEQTRKILFNAMFEFSQAKPFLTPKRLDNELLDLVGKRTQGFVAGDLALLVQNIEQNQVKQEKDFDITHFVKSALNNVRPAAVHTADVRVYKFVDGFETIGGMDKLKRTMEVSILAGLRKQEKFRKFGLKLPKGLLLYGPPGCAKTTFAKCLAKEADMTFISIASADVYSPYVGAAEKFIVRIFDTARKNAPCLIFFDEIDTLAGRRPISSNSSSDVQVRILSTLLTEMDGVIDGSDENSQQILVVAASNRPDMIDDALLRPGRLSKHIYVPAPDLQSRISILQLIAKRMPFAADVNINKIAAETELYTGADMCNLCNEAALLAFERLSMDSSEDDYKIKAKEFDFALKNSKSSLSTNQLSLYTKFQKKIEAKS